MNYILMVLSLAVSLLKKEFIIYKEQKYIEDIVRNLSFITTTIKRFNKLNLYDLNIHSEDFFCSLLNIVYNLNLTNLNIKDKNTPSIDLGDIDKKICYQITSTNDSSKIKKTISKFEKYNLYNNFNELFILLLKNKKNYTTTFVINGKYKFSNQNIMDIDDLILKIKSKSIHEIEQISQFIKENLIFLQFNPSITTHTPDLNYLNFWFKEACIDNFRYYCSRLPFGFYDVKYSYYFIESLKSYLNKHDTFLNGTISKNSNNLIKSKVSTFNNYAKALLTAIDKHTSKQDITTNNNDGDIILTYWINCENLPYHERGNYIENEKNNLRNIFYNLIKISNDIISVWNIGYNNGKQISLIEFAQLNPNFGLLGDLYLIEPHYPKSEN